MKRSLLGSAVALALTMGLAQGSFEPAEAGDWYIGGGFKVGGLHFSLAFDRAFGRHHRPYYRTSHHVRYDGYKCGSYCSKRSGYYYHHASCPLVLHHFRRHGFHPASVWGGFGHGPGYDRYYGHRDYGYRDHGHRDYGYRRDEHRDHRYKYKDRGRYDRRRYDHRGHDSRSCPYR